MCFERLKRNEKVKAANVLLAEDLKHNLLSVSKMCDQGYNLIFNSWKCEIRQADSGRLVATVDTKRGGESVLSCFHFFLTFQNTLVSSTYLFNMNFSPQMII